MFYNNFKALYDDYYEDDGACWEVRDAVYGNDEDIYIETYFEDFPYIYFTLPEDDDDDDDDDDGSCVIATHALKHGGFAPEVKSRAEDWCVRNLHDRWYGEAWRRGYRYYGRKYIENGTAHQRYQEFQDIVDFVTGHNRTLRGAISFVCRTVQFFLKGLFISDEHKDKR
jgi:hypothetical protein